MTPTDICMETLQTALTILSEATLESSNESLLTYIELAKDHINSGLSDIIMLPPPVPIVHFVVPTLGPPPPIIPPVSPIPPLPALPPPPTPAPLGDPPRVHGLKNNGHPCIMIAAASKRLNLEIAISPLHTSLI